MAVMLASPVYTAPDNYESEKDRSLRIYLETKKQQQAKQEAMEAELVELSYSEWASTIIEFEKQSLLPENIANGKLEGAKISVLKAHFRKNIWPSRKND